MEAVQALGINPGYLLGYSLNVILMIIILRVVAWKPLTDMLTARRERIAEGINNARKAEEALQSAEADKQALLDDARAEAQKIITEARSRTEENQRATIAAAERDAQETREKALAEAQRIREDALADMRDQIVDLSIAAANHLVGSMDEDRQREMVNTFFTEIPEAAQDFTGDVVVITAVPLTDEEKDAARAKLTNAGSIDFRVDPGILGGAVVRAGAREVDNSFSAQLSSMRQSLN